MTGCWHFCLRSVCERLPAVSRLQPKDSPKQALGKCLRSGRKQVPLNTFDIKISKKGTGCGLPGVSEQTQEGRRGGPWGPWGPGWGHQRPPRKCCAAPGAGKAGPWGSLVSPSSAARVSDRRAKPLGLSPLLWTGSNTAPWQGCHEPQGSGSAQLGLTNRKMLAP